MSDASERICSLSFDLRELSHLSLATSTGMPRGRYAPKNRFLAVDDDDGEALDVGGGENASA